MRHLQIPMLSFICKRASTITMGSEGMLTRDSDPSGVRAGLNPPDKLSRPAEILAEARSRGKGRARMSGWQRKEVINIS